jgi:hypothetical protein
VPDPRIEGTKVLQGLVLVVLVLDFLWKLLFQKAVMVVVVERRDRKLHLGLEDLILMLATNPVLELLVREILPDLLRWIIGLLGLVVAVNDVLEGKTATLVLAMGIHHHRLLLL